MYECAGCGKPYSNMHDAAACCSNGPGMAPNTAPLATEPGEDEGYDEVLEDQEEQSSR